MKVLNALTLTVGIIAPSLAVASPTPQEPLPFEQLAAECAPDVHPTTLKAVVTTESSWNPYAIGVVNGYLERQPRTLDEAIATAHELEEQGYNFSLGLGQVNRHNLSKFGETYETVFDPCRNLKTGSAILKDCYERARGQFDDEQTSLQAAFSCYYSGNFTRGFRPDNAGEPSYVQKVLANATSDAKPIHVVPAITTTNTNSAAPVRAKRQSTATARKEKPEDWVIITDAKPATQEPSAESVEQDAEEMPVKARLAASPTNEQSAPTEASPKPSDHSGQDEAPFVIFVN